MAPGEEPTRREQDDSAVSLVRCLHHTEGGTPLAYKHAIPAAGVRALRDAMRGQLVVARQQIHDASNHGEMAEGRAHLNLVCDMLDALGWEDCDPEVDVPVEPVRDALRDHLAKEHELAHTHDPDQRERAIMMTRLIEAVLDAIEPEDQP